MGVEYEGVGPAHGELEAVLAARYGAGVYDKLKAARVAVAGLGGLGSHIAVALARVGVGFLFLVDFDVVEPSNLNRQSYFVGDVGRLKTEALREQIEAINPLVEVAVRAVRVEEHNIVELFGGCDVLCEALDDQEAKAGLVSTALAGLPGLKVVAASGMAGYGSANSIRTQRRLKNLYVCGDGEGCGGSGMKDTKSVGEYMGFMAPRVQICAGHQANMTLRLLAGLEEA
ncbi:MAG: sulfur carrier protein ThiS adenylyltransferase ThiF [Peptococcaceae bacterium]|nr:sulfur carrier protein ThiS adenylyltransferase ThiF [Peptococcaceae bacterium]